MTNREAKMVKNTIDSACIALSHALEEPSATEEYIHITMDWLNQLGEYIEVRERNNYVWQQKNIDDDTE